MRNKIKRQIIKEKFKAKFAKMLDTTHTYIHGGFLLNKKTIIICAILIVIILQLIIIVNNNSYHVFEIPVEMDAFFSKLSIYERNDKKNYKYY